MLIHDITRGQQFQISAEKPDSLVNYFLRCHHLLKYMLRSPYTCLKNGSFKSLMK